MPLALYFPKPHVDRWRNNLAWGLWARLEVLLPYPPSPTAVVRDNTPDFASLSVWRENSNYTNFNKITKYKK